MEIGSSTIAFVIGFLLVVAYLWTRKPWTKRTDQELVAIAAGSDWRYWKDALAELRRRGHDIHGYIPTVATRLVSDSRLEREAARHTLSDLFPEWQERLAACGYLPSQEPPEARAKLKPVFASFQLPLP